MDNAELKKNKAVSIDGSASSTEYNHTGKRNCLFDIVFKSIVKTTAKEDYVAN